MRLSLIIPAKSKDDPKLKELLASIEAQDFPKSEMETLVITEGTSESAKAIGIRKAHGEVIGILASDNELIGENFLSRHYRMANIEGAAQTSKYFYEPKDNILNRYFALFGFNDPLAFYMEKCDRVPAIDEIGPFEPKAGATIGDNGFFVRKVLIENTDLDNYYHIDNALEAVDKPFYLYGSIWHKTGGNIFKFFTKRYRYGLQHAFNSNRRWHLVDFHKPKDIVRLLWFILCGLTLVQPLYLSFRGWLKIRDIAWFLHPVVTLLTILNYSVLMIHIGLRHIFQLLSAHMNVRTA